MRLRRPVLVLLLAASFSAGSVTTPVSSPPAEASTRTVEYAGVSITVPTKWDFRPMPGTSEATSGIQASSNLHRWGSLERREYGVEAWWVDASKLDVPSDYYYLAAEGPAMRRLPSGRICAGERRRVVANREPLFDRRRDSPGDFVATASGTCFARHQAVVWTSFVAAPGFGPVRRLGIPESGLYFAFVMVPDGPRAKQRADRLLGQVRFGPSTVSDLLTEARLGQA